jgi:adenosylcobalamin-dependent ribonucleoside-triphosphate reductase
MSNLDYIAEIIDPKYLNASFLQPYLEKDAPFGSDLGYIVYLRTYSRYIPSLRRRETWAETVCRVVEYSMSLYKGDASFYELKQEAEELYDYMFNQKVFPSGRTLWVGGVPAVDGLAQFNCSFRTIDGIEAFVDIFYALLLGVGVGFSVENKHINSLPWFNRALKVHHKPYDSLPKQVRDEHTTISFDETSSIVVGEEFLKDNNAKCCNILDCTKGVKKLGSKLPFIRQLWNDIRLQPSRIRVTINIGDSKTGWVNALKLYLYLHCDRHVEEITFVYDNVRPKGERIKGFGGRASGPESLQRMFEKIHNTIVGDKKESSLGRIEKALNKLSIISKPDFCRLSSVQAMDIANFIAEGVVSGGVRRSSLLSLGDIIDDDFINAKLDLYTDESKAHLRSSRTMSNNSVHFQQKPSLEKLKEIFESIKNNGEPGFVNKEAASKRRPFYEGLNPCAEILLRSEQTCNLVTIPLPKFVTPGGEFDYIGFQKAARLAVRMCSRITNLDMFKKSWDKTQKKDRLLGVSITGIVDAINLLGWDKIRVDTSISEKEPQFIVDYNTTPITTTLSTTRKLMREEADKYHEEMGINKALLITTIKPEGTISNLPSVSSGIHAPYAPFYKRRIRINKYDPIAKALLEMGYTPVPENNQGDNLHAPECDTWVFTFPVKTTAAFKSIDESAISQLERYKIMMENYVDHNCSITVSVSPNEWEKVTEWVYKNWDYVVGISFLPRFDSSDSPYPNMPFETCSEEDYQELVKKNPRLNKEALLQLIAKFETETEYEQYEPTDPSCSTGACPIR